MQCLYIVLDIVLAELELNLLVYLCMTLIDYDINVYRIQWQCFNYDGINIILEMQHRSQAQRGDLSYGPMAIKIRPG